MIDIHTHIIPSIDDGSKSVEETFELFKEAAEAGFTDIILTPHYINGYYETNTNIREYWVKSLQETLNKLEIPIRVFVGNEIYICENMDELISNNIVSPLNNSKYILFELPMNTNVAYLEKIIFRIINIDKIPILAHPERYSYVQKDISIIEKLRQQGVLFQAKYGSIVGLYGDDTRKTLEKLLKKDLIDFVASDVHIKKSIYTVVDDAKKRLKKIIGNDKLEKLTTYNPQKIILNKDI